MHARQFHDAAVLAHGLADALVAFFILHLHAAQVGGNADMVGDKYEQRVGIRILTIILKGGQLLFIGPAAKKILYPAHEENLKRRHQRRRTGTVENLRQIVFRKIELEETEVAQIGRHQMLEDCIPKALAEKSLVAHEYIRRAQPARFQFADKALGLGEGPHQFPPLMRKVIMVKLMVSDSSIDNPIRIVILGVRLRGQDAPATAGRMPALLR